MESVVLVIHLILALAIILLVLLQRSEGGGLGIGGGNGGLGGLASARGTANMLTKMTAFCAAGFFVTSLTLGVLASQKSNISSGILDDMSETEIHAPVASDDVFAPDAGITFIPPSEIPELNIEDSSQVESDPVDTVKDEKIIQNEEPEGDKPVE